MQKIHNLDHTKINLKQQQAIGGGNHLPSTTNFYSDLSAGRGNEELEEIVEKPRLNRNSSSDNEYDHLDIIKWESQMRTYFSKVAKSQEDNNPNVYCEQYLREKVSKF